MTEVAALPSSARFGEQSFQQQLDQLERSSAQHGAPSAHLAKSTTKRSSNVASSSSPRSLPSSSSAGLNGAKPSKQNAPPNGIEASINDHGALQALLAEPLEFVKSKKSHMARPIDYVPINDPKKPGESSDAVLIKPQNGSPSAPASLNGKARSQSTSSHLSVEQASTSQLLDGSGTPQNKGRDLFPHRLALTFPSVNLSGRGLSNYGNTCYMNSVVQALVHTPPLAHCLLTMSLDQLLGPFGRANGFCAVRSMAALTKRCLKERTPTAPTEFIKNLKQFAKPLRPGRQEDSHEFLRFLLEAMQQSCVVGAGSKLKPHDRIRESTFVHKVFGGRLRSRVTCDVCKHNSDTYDPILDLSLDVRGGISSVTEALKSFVHKDRLTGTEKYKCEKCKRPVNATKQFTIHEAPTVLTIHLKRFGLTGNKLNRQIQFGDLLSLSPYMSEGQHGPRYRLYAVVHHFGHGPNSGHYVASVLSPSKRWMRMDDSSVSPMSRSPSGDASAYVLFYVREQGDALADAIGMNAKSGSGFQKAPAVNGAASPAQQQQQQNKVDGANSSRPGKRKLINSDEDEDEDEEMGSPVSTGPNGPRPIMNGKSPSPTKKSSWAQSVLEEASRNGRSPSAGAGAGKPSGKQAGQSSISSPTPAGSFYGKAGLDSSRPKAKANPFTMPSPSASVDGAGAGDEELGDAVERDDYESLVGGGGGGGGSSHARSAASSQERGEPLSKKQRRALWKAAERSGPHNGGSIFRNLSPHKTPPKGVADRMKPRA